MRECFFRVSPCEAVTDPCGHHLQFSLESNNFFTNSCSFMSDLLTIHYRDYGNIRFFSKSETVFTWSDFIVFAYSQPNVNHFCT